jgi:hypothetical protein
LYSPIFYNLYIYGYIIVVDIDIIAIYQFIRPNH